MAVLVIAEHDNRALKDATDKTVTAAAELGGPVHVLVAGSGASAVAEAAGKLAGVEKVLYADDPSLAHMLAEPMAALIVPLMANYDAVLAPATTTGKNILPRVAALLDVMQISDIVAVVATRHIRAADLCRQRAANGQDQRRQEGDHGTDHRVQSRRAHRLRAGRKYRGAER